MKQTKLLNLETSCHDVENGWFFLHEKTIFIEMLRTTNERYSEDSEKPSLDNFLRDIS